MHQTMHKKYELTSKLASKMHEKYELTNKNDHASKI
jgi:hypothetical protein